MSASAPDLVDATASFRIRFRPFPTLFERGNEPALVLRELAELGEVRTTCNLAAVPGLEDLDPAGAYLSWTVEVQTEAGEAALREPFEFVEGDCELAIEALSPEPPAKAASDPDPSNAAPDGEAAAPGPERASWAATPAGAVDKPLPEPAAARRAGPEGGPAARPGGGATVRVDLDRVDRLIDLVGELVINQAMLSQSMTLSGVGTSSPAAAGFDELRQLTREIQESVLAIRAQPVKALFQRMARIVREAGDATGKEVRLVTEGEMTEVDKTVIERLADPLTHMIRNAVDHGLERPERRLERGKSAEGLVRLTAEHRSGRVLIEISDDGAGIDRDRVQQIAIEKGLIAADASLSKAEIDHLLFVPGFSTAATVSDLSGRGVGMDVVKRSIVALGGRISIASNPGQGTCFSISLPLTLAILDGMVVSVAGETVVVPLSAILEMLKPGPEQVHRLGVEGAVIQVRGEFVPVIDVGRELGFMAGPGDPRERVVLLIETSGGERRALMVDAIQEQRQVVIKGLGETCGAVSGIAAATILGDGRIALILDTDAIVRDAVDRAAPTRPTLAMAG